MKKNVAAALAGALSLSLAAGVVAADTWYLEGKKPVHLRVGAIAPVVVAERFMRAKPVPPGQRAKVTGLTKEIETNGQPMYKLNCTARGPGFGVFAA